MQDGIAPGGLNFDAKVRRESTDLKDLFIAHAAAMDTFARGLKNAARMMADGVFAKSINVSFFLVFLFLFCSLCICVSVGDDRELGKRKSKVRTLFLPLTGGLVVSESSKANRQTTVTREMRKVLLIRRTADKED